MKDVTIERTMPLGFSALVCPVKAIHGLLNSSEYHSAPRNHWNSAATRMA